SGPRRREPAAAEASAARRLRAGDERRPLGIAAFGGGGREIGGRSDFTCQSEARAEDTAAGDRGGERCGKLGRQGLGDHDRWLLGLELEAEIGGGGGGGQRAGRPIGGAGFGEAGAGHGGGGAP